MSALTAAAVAAQPATAPTSSVSPRMATVPAAHLHLAVQHQQQQQQHPHPQTILSTATAPPHHTISNLGPGNPNSPLGKVVESGHEHTGRWTKEEHEAFLSALQLYGKEWKKVAARVKTRTVVQTRTHAQKYFQKLQKVLEAGGDKEASSALGMVGVPSPGITLGSSGSSNNQASSPMAHSNLNAIMDMGVPNTSEKKTKKRGPAAGRMPHTKPPPKQPYQAQQHPQQTYQTQQVVATPAASMSRSNSATAAALLNMSNDRRILSTTVGPPSTAPTAGAYSAVTHTVPGASSPHGFGYPTVASTGATANNALITNPPAGKISLGAISNHDDMVHSGSKFPEPSPAACGKRKMAEIAAAQMLAGVVRAAEKSALDAAAATAQQQQQYDLNPTPRKRASVSGAAEDIVMATAAGEPITATDFLDAAEDLRPTPPLPGTEGGESVAPGNSHLLSGSMSLQIVNPDTLATNQGNQGMAKRRMMNGQASPLTPWDGQLELLVSQVKCQEPPPQDPEMAATTEALMSSDPSEEPEVPPQSTGVLPAPLRNPRSALQHAVCSGSIHEVSELCSSISTPHAPIIAERDDAGFHPLHSAAALGMSPHFGPHSPEALEITRLLIDAGADVACRDAHGNTPVHWAARAGHSDVLALLISKSCPMDMPNDGGETALHWAMRAGYDAVGGSSAVQILVENGARVNVFNRNFRRPLDVAAEGFAGLEEETNGDGSAENENLAAVDRRIDQRIRRATRWNLMRHSSQCRTLVLHHQECLDHLAKSDHDWEVPDRIENIMSTLTSRTNTSELSNVSLGDNDTFQPYEVTISNEFERATLELLSRIHSAEYLAFVNDLSKDLERKRKQQLIEEAQAKLEGGDEGSDVTSEKARTVVPFTPMVQRKILKEEKTKEDGNSDTAFSAGSLKAARRAAGAVQHAVDCVLVGRNRNAFCIVRPPGHHAGINGLLSDAESCGFCLFNNVAAGAMHALSDEKHRPRCERCAIVDVDAHHGNGTEEIVRKCHDSGRLLFFSVHLYDHDKPPKKKDNNSPGFQYKFFPGTGADDDVAHNVINVPIAPLWREKEVVKSISLASNGGVPPPPEPRQTRQRSKEEAKAATLRASSPPDPSKLNNEESVQGAGVGVETSSNDVSNTSESLDASKPRSSLPSSSPHYPPHYLMGVGRLAYRRAIQHRLLPALRAFNPDLIILSTGFDAARGDVGNARHYTNGTQAMGLDLEPDDYAWTARKVCEVADICCDGRVVSVLEGGYGRTPPIVPPPPLSGGQPPEVSAKQKLDKSFFGECAIQHLKGLVDPYYPGDDEQQQKGTSNRK